MEVSYRFHQELHRTHQEKVTFTMIQLPKYQRRPGKVERGPIKDPRKGSKVLTHYKLQHERRWRAI